MTSKKPLYLANPYGFCLQQRAGPWMASGDAVSPREHVVHRRLQGLGMSALARSFPVKAA